MDEFALLLDLHRGQRRQGPGTDADTRMAIALAGLVSAPGLEVADIGCGTGASTLVLASELDASVTAVDLFPEFLDELSRRAGAAGLGDRIETLAASMDNLPFKDGSLDVIWSEGGIYNIGFEAGIASWRRFLRPGGILAVSELTWLTAERPEELEEHWLREYPDVATASAKIGLLERHGYTLLGYFPLSEEGWLDNYYRPLEAEFAAFLARHRHSDAARAIVEGERHEISLYERFSDFFGYGFYVAKKTSG